MYTTRRNLLFGTAATIVAMTTGACSSSAAQQPQAQPSAPPTPPFQPNQRYPDPAIEILDPSITKYRLFSSSLEQVATGMRWAEGPVYFPDGGYLLCSDTPNNRLMKFDEKDGSFTVFRHPSNYSNGNTRDRQGRLVTCEHSETRRITRTEENGDITVLADSFEGKRLNAPNDIVVKSDDTIWFTDPLFGINGEWEGSRAEPEQATTNVYRLTPDGELTAVITDLVNPNGIGFSPDEKKGIRPSAARTARGRHPRNRSAHRHLQARDVDGVDRALCREPARRPRGHARRADSRAGTSCAGALLAPSSALRWA